MSRNNGHFSRAPFYHVCKECNAKFFSPRRIEECPRCAKLSGSRERLYPPWVRQAEEHLSAEDLKNGDVGDESAM